MELHVRVVSARNLLDKQTFGRQDPYCKVAVGGKKFKTRVHDNGHRTPVWDEKFVFQVYDPQLEQLHVQIKDKNFTASVLIGEVRLPVNMFLHGAVTDQWYTINNGAKRGGEINLRVQLLGGGSGGAMATKPSKMAQGYTAATASAAYGYAPPPQAYPAYPQPPPQMYPAPPQYAQPPPPQYAQPPPPQYAPAPPPQYQYAPPPPMYQMAPPPPPMVIAAPPPVMMAPPPQVVYTPGVAYAAPGYYPSSHHGHRYDGGDGGYHHRGGGVSGGQVALGVGAGVVGGLLLGEVLDDIF